MQTKPPPLFGMVIRYDYLWHDQDINGQKQGSKDRPCLIVNINTKTNPSMIMALPITHAKPENTSTSILIPPTIKHQLKLDTLPQWIVTSEANRFTWNNPGIIPVNSTYWIYGIMPHKIMKPALESLLNHAKSGHFAIIKRTD